MKPLRLYLALTCSMVICFFATSAAFAAPMATNTTQSAVPPSVPINGPVRYVTDQFQITLRSGPGINHQILAMLKSGQPVTVIKQDPQTGYTEVRLSNGVQGWVLTRFLMGHPAARVELANAQKLLAEANANVSKLKASLAKVQTELSDRVKSEKILQTKYLALQKQYQNLLETAKNAVALMKENKALATKEAELTRQLAAIKKENENLRNSRFVQWFLIGAGVLLTGLILGLLMPSLARRRKDNWFT